MDLKKMCLGCVLIMLIISGCNGSPWSCGSCDTAPVVVSPQDACTSYGNVTCPGNCTSHPWSTWYPGKHIIRGFHHACSLFTCYGCGGNCWCGQGYNAGGAGGLNSGWNPPPGEVVIDQQLEPIPTTGKSPSNNLPTSQPPTPK